MGLFGSIGKFLTGGPAAKGYTSKYTPQYETGARTSVMNRAGARVTGKDAQGNDVYDFSGTGKQVGAGSQGYNMGGVDSGIAGIKQPSSYQPTRYNTAKFDFAAKPDEYYKTEYELGAGDIRREGQGQLEQIRESVGPRRAGLLLKAGQNAQRSVAENLARMRAGLGQEAMREKSDLGMRQQIAQAEEDFKAAGYSDEQSRYMAEDKLRRSQALYDAAKGKVGLESDLTERERSYQDKSLEYLQDMFYKNAGLAGQEADRKNANKGGVLNTIASAAGSFAKIKGG